MIKRIILPLVLAVFLAALAVPVLIFFNRSAVLVVTDESFALLYGAKRMQRQQLSASLALFRQVKPVVIADGASPDILIFAIGEVSHQPFSVLFPYSHAAAAEQYHEQFPDVPVVLLGGLIPDLPKPAEDGFFSVYVTDRETDLYRAGLFAGILGGTVPKPEEQGETVDEEAPAQRIVVLYQDDSVQEGERELFNRGVREQNPDLSVRFVSAVSQLPRAVEIACAVLSGAGGEYLERNPKMPMIIFTWLDPELIATEIAVVFDDSHWAMIVPAVLMALEKQVDGKIPSAPLILSARIADNGMVGKLKKSAEKNAVKLAESSESTIDKDSAK